MKFVYAYAGRMPTMNVEINEAKRHWSNWSNRKRDLTDGIALLMKSAARGLAVMRGPVRIRFDWTVRIARNGAAPDPDNVRFAAKYLLDALQRADVILNDDWRTIRELSDTYRYGEDVEDGVTITVEEIDDAGREDPHSEQAGGGPAADEGRAPEGRRGAARHAVPLRQAADRRDQRGPVRPMGSRPGTRR